MATLEQFKDILVKTLGFKEHQINTGEGNGVASTIEGLDDKAEFLVTTTVGNCYAAFNHNGATLSEAEANRYKALTILMPNGPAAYCVVQTGENLRLFYVEKGNELHDSIEEWDAVRDAEDMVKELKPDIVDSLEQWARKTLHTENSLSRFVQLMKGCWQDIWDIENKRNDWIFDEFTRFLFIKLNEDAKPNGAFTTAKFKSYCAENKHMGDKAGQNFINNLFDDLKGRHPEVFTDENERVLSKSETVSRVIARLEDINLKDTQGDVLGRAFEIMLSDTFKGKDLGQFFTPREIVAFMLDLAREAPEAPALDIERNQRFLDACAGSGGFLIATYEDVYKHTLSNGIEQAKKEELLKRLGQSTFFAAEIEEKAARLGKLNMIIHAVDQRNANWLHQNYIYNEDFGGLKPQIEYEVDFGSGKQKQKIGPNSIDLILTNPPFGKSVKSGTTLINYEFGSMVKEYKTKPSKRVARQSQESEILFIEHYVRALKPGGKLLIILPDGLLSTRSCAQIREYLRENTVLKSIISLPIETFMSTSAQIPTSIVYLQKKTTNSVQGPVFMAKAKNVGRKANGEFCPGSELPTILENSRLFSEGAKEIKGSRLGFHVDLNVNDKPERLDVDAYWKGDDFDILSNDSLKAIKSVNSNFNQAFEDINYLLTQIQSIQSELSSLDDAIANESVANLEPLSNLLKPVSRPVDIESDFEYRLVGVRWYGEGAYIKDIKTGDLIKANKLYKTHKGDLIVSRLFAWKGSIAMVNEDCHEGVASNEFPMYVANSEISIEYISSLLQSPSIWADINKLCTGTSKQSRNRIHEDDFLALQIPIIATAEGREHYLACTNKLRELVEHIRRLSDISNVLGFLQKTRDLHRMNSRIIELDG